ATSSTRSSKHNPQGRPRNGRSAPSRRNRVTRRANLRGRSPLNNSTITGSAAEITATGTRYRLPLNNLRDNPYHGRTNLTMALTAKSMPYKAHFGPFAPEIYRMPASYPYRDGLTGEQAAHRAITRIEKQIGADSLAALVYEPIQGEGGFIVPAPGFVPALAAWAKANEV